MDSSLKSSYAETLHTSTLLNYRYDYYVNTQFIQIHICIDINLHIQDYYLTVNHYIIIILQFLKHAYSQNYPL